MPILRTVKRVAFWCLLLSLSRLFLSSALAQEGGLTSGILTSALNSERDWWKNAVIYEIFPRSFQDTNGDGIGDLNGINQHLDYLQRLGVDAIWLTPAYPSPNADYGYDVADYQNINPEFGTLQDFDRLVVEANKRHIRVIMDMVMNHSSDQNPWFIQSRSSRDNPYRDWYVWRDGKGETATSPGGPPNNWGMGGRSPWEWDETTRQYYYHHFSPHQPDLNWYNPAIEQTFKDIISFWLKRGVGGFRFDAVGTLFEDPTYSDEEVSKDKSGNPVVDLNGNPVYERVKEGNLPAVDTVMQQIRAHIDTFNTDEYPGTRVMIGETPTRTLDQLRKWYGPEGTPEFELPMDGLGSINKLDVTAFRQKLIDAENGIGKNVPCLVFDNHDGPRMDTRFGDGVHDVAIQRVLSAILFASGGASLMYYGDEIGMKTTPPAHIEDVKDTMEGLRNWPTNKGRDGERTPMQWTSVHNAGFTTGIPWLPVPLSASTINVQAEEKDQNSLLAWYRTLIHLKKTNVALARGTNTMLDVENTKVLSWERNAAGSAPVIVSVNFTAQSQTVDLTIATGGKLTGSLRTLIASPGESNPASLSRIDLEPFGVIIGVVQ